MKPEVVVVGSGASGIHLAASLLDKGLRVTMVDVGFSGPATQRADDSFQELKINLEDPVAYFLGSRFESVIPPDYDQEIYEFPPNKMYIFKHPGRFPYAAEGFEPLFSFARGGLAEAWTGGCYPFDEADLKEFPFDYKTLQPYYERVAEAIGVIGCDDDLARFFPLHRHLLPPLELDEHSVHLVDAYTRRREKIQHRLQVSLGRSRIATLSCDLGNRAACDYSGRCLWGCPTSSLYVPSLTLERCLSHENFRYLDGRQVSHFTVDAQNRVSGLVMRVLETGEVATLPVQYLALAAGTLSTAKIFLDSLYVRDGRCQSLPGLMDNRQVLVPFINTKMIPRPYDARNYQYHQLALGFNSSCSGHYVHGQITTLKTALMEPVLQSIPTDLKTALHLGKNLHSSLGVANINFADWRRPENTVGIEPAERTGDGIPATRLRIRYLAHKDEKKEIKAALKRVKRFFTALGVVIPPTMAHMRPMGSSVHYSGTLPMSVERKPFTVSPTCRSHDFDNLIIADGSVLPFLPAKNLTFTLMANATRIADLNF